jgi:fucose permease
MTRTFSRDQFTWLAYLLLAFYAYILNVFGPITPFLKSELGLSYTVSSLHFTAFAAGIILVGLGGHWLIQRIGRRRSLWLGALGMSLGAVPLLTGRHPAVTIGASFLMGLIGSLILAIVPAALSDRHGELRSVALSEANAVSSMVAAAAPLMVGWFARSEAGWRLALGLIVFVPLFLFPVFGKAVSPATQSEGATSAQPRKPLPALFWVYWWAIVLGVSIEFCMLSWSSDFLENALNVPRADAAQAVSLFIAAMITGRMAGSRLVQRFSMSTVVTASSLVAGAGFLLFWRAAAAGPALIGLFLVGLGVANFYPLLLSLAMGAALADTVRASSRATLASGTAILILPLILGRLADGFGIRPAYGVVLLLLLCIFGVVRLAGKISASQALQTVIPGPVIPSEQHDQL